jgi:hypothetical protein
VAVCKVHREEEYKDGTIINVAVKAEKEKENTPSGYHKREGKSL